MNQKNSKKLSKLKHTEKKRMKSNINSASVTCGTTSNCLINTCAISVPERNEEEKTFE